MAVGREHDERQRRGRIGGRSGHPFRGREDGLEVEAVCEAEAVAVRSARGRVPDPGKRDTSDGNPDVYEVEPVLVVPARPARHLRLVPDRPAAPITPERPHPSPPAATTTRAQKNAWPAPPARTASAVRIHGVDWTHLYQLQRTLWWSDQGQAWLAHPLAAAAQARDPGPTTEQFLGLLERELRRGPAGRRAPAAGAEGRRRRLPLLPVAGAIGAALRAEAALLETALVARRDGDHRGAATALHELERRAPTALGATLLAECYEALGRPVHAWQWAVFATCRRPRWPYDVRARHVRVRNEAAARSGAAGSGRLDRSR